MTQRDAPNIVILPPVAFLIAFGAAVGLDWLAPLPAAAVPWFGYGLAAASVALAVWGIVAFKRAGTNVQPHKPALTLVEGGPYRITRNPMYVGFIGLLIGLGLGWPNLWAVVLAPGLWAVLHWGVVLREEAYLTAKFGAPYTAFMERTRRWL